MKLKIFLIQFSLLYFCGQISGSKLGDQEYPVTLYIGSYSPPVGTGSGITLLEQDDPSTNFNAVGSLFIQSASYMAMDAKQAFVYTISELNDYASEPGLLWALPVTHPGGNLTIGSSMGIPGYQPCHITLDPTGTFVLISNYGSGNVLVYQLNEDGLIGSRTDNLVAPGNDPSMANAHMLHFDPNDASHAAVCYLGLDAVYFYEFSSDGHLTPYTLTLTNGTEVQIKAEVDPGSGPRHITYTSDGKYFYVINEKASTIATFQTEIDPSTGLYRRIQTISTHPQSYNGTNWAAEIAIHPNGLFLYASERGDNSIAIYSIDQDTGILTSIGFQSTTGNTPRYFVIEPSGSVLYVGNQNGNNIDVFSIDEYGGLTLTQTIQNIPSPAFILYANLMDN